MKGNELFLENIREDIVKLVQGETMPWTKSWEKVPRIMPVNAKTGNFYSGQNMMRLFINYWVRGYKTATYATYKQLAAIGGQVRKGEKGTRVLIYRLNQEKEEDNETEDKKKRFPFLRVATVFNIEQADGLEEFLQLEETDPATLPALLQSILTTHKPKILPGNPAFNPSNGAIYMPAISKFKSEGYYYATLLHELAHWTMTEDKLDRSLDEVSEEMVAEISAYMMCSILSLPFDPRDSASYLQSWQSHAEVPIEELYQNAFLEAGKVVSYLLKPIQSTLGNKTTESLEA